VRERLASIKTPGTFATRRTSAADDLCPRWTPKTGH